MPVIISSTNDRGQDKEWMEKYSHLLKPPLQIGDQKVEKANVPPLVLKDLPASLYTRQGLPASLITRQELPASLLHFIPPRVWVGVPVERQAILDLAVKHGYPSNGPIFSCAAPFLAEKLSRIVRFTVQCQHVFNGKDMQNHEHTQFIFAFGSNHDMPALRKVKQRQIEQATSFLSSTMDQIKWWVDSAEWFWDYPYDRYAVRCWNQQFQECMRRDTQSRVQNSVVHDM